MQRRGETAMIIKVYCPKCDNRMVPKLKEYGGKVTHRCGKCNLDNLVEFDIENIEIKIPRV